MKSGTFKKSLVKKKLGRSSRLAASTMALRSPLRLCRSLRTPREILLQSPNLSHRHPASGNLLLMHHRLLSDVTTKSPAGTADSSTAGFTTVPSSLDSAEVAKFAAIADTWWDCEGPYKPLHLMNPTRVSFIRSTLCRHFGRDPQCARPFQGLKFVDVGCGGGILSEAFYVQESMMSRRMPRRPLRRLGASGGGCALTAALRLVHPLVSFNGSMIGPLARMGATVTGIDAVEKNIKIASLHAGLDPLTSTIEYRCATAEQLVEEKKQFDAVLSLEVIEHVADPSSFCKSLAELTVASGAFVISTINRSMRSYTTAIIAAEYLLNWLPKGTHEWSSFLTPEELVLILQRAGMSVEEMAGFMYNPVSGEWSLSDDLSVNFIAFGNKVKQ